METHIFSSEKKVQVSSHYRKSDDDCFLEHLKATYITVDFLEKGTTMNSGTVRF